jgi:hypothetical protein
VWVCVREHDLVQEETYAAVASDVVEDFLQGFHGTILAYGQTGAGKTHTVFGNDSSYWDTDYEAREALAETERPLPSNAGIVPRAVHHIIQHVNKATSRGADVTLTFSMLQVYMEDITDLLAPFLSPETTDCKLQIREDPKHGIFVDGLNQVMINSTKEALRVIKEAVEQRATGSTQQNHVSSRSHALLQFTFGQFEAGDDGKGVLSRSILSIIDLAGSERISKSGSAGTRLEEAKMINKSISALGNCVSALAGIEAEARASAGAPLPPAAGQTTHVPFRDSKLTRLLTNSFGGNSKTVLCANVGPAQGGVDETLSTLAFAQRAMIVQNKAVQNTRTEAAPAQHCLTVTAQHAHAAAEAFNGSMSGARRSAALGGFDGAAVDEEVVERRVVEAVAAAEAKWQQREAALQAQLAGMRAEAGAMQHKVASQNVMIAQLSAQNMQHQQAVEKAGAAGAGGALGAGGATAGAEAVVVAAAAEKAEEAALARVAAELLAAPTLRRFLLEGAASVAEGQQGQPAGACAGPSNGRGGSHGGGERRLVREYGPASPAESYSAGGY